MAEVNRENYEKCIKITSEIDKLFIEIHRDTAFSSNHGDILQHPNFEILKEKYGKKITAYIFHCIIQEGANWTYFLFLGQIFKEAQVDSNHRGQLYYVLIHWLQWYVESPYYNHDVYFDLLEV